MAHEPMYTYIHNVKSTPLASEPFVFWRTAKFSLVFI